MKIRRAAIGDEYAIAKVIVDTWKEAYQGIVPQGYLNSLTTEKHEQLFKLELTENTKMICVLETEGKVIGMISGGSEPTGKYDGEIVAIYIMKKYQNCGFGKQLFAEVVENFKKQGYKTMIIWTFETNKDRVFYKKMGGHVKENKRYRVADVELPLVGFVWEDINKISD